MPCSAQPGVLEHASSPFKNKIRKQISQAIKKTTNITNYAYNSN
jgi:hypothetical protein